MSLLLSASEKSKNVTSSSGSGSFERIFLCHRRVTGQDQVPETLRSPDETAEPEKFFMSKSKFAIQTYGKSEFAMLLFPDIDNPKVAQAKLLR